MSTALQLVSVSLISAAFSLIVLRALSRPLADVLERLCPDRTSANFWLRYAQVMLTIAPLMAALLVDSCGTQRSPVQILRLTLLASGAGLLGGLWAIGRRLARFVRVPQTGEPS